MSFLFQCQRLVLYWLCCKCIHREGYFYLNNKYKTQLYFSLEYFCSGTCWEDCTYRSTLEMRSLCFLMIHQLAKQCFLQQVLALIDASPHMKYIAVSLSCHDLHLCMWRNHKHLCDLWPLENACLGGSSLLTRLTRVVRYLFLLLLGKGYTFRYC